MITTPAPSISPDPLFLVRCILAVDLATKTGWALWTPEWDAPESGVVDFSPGRGESPGMRFVKFRAWLNRITEQFSPDLYVYEAAHHRGGAATEVCVGLATRVVEAAAGAGANYVPVRTTTLKKFATGAGNAGKPEMIEAAHKRWGFQPKDDNQADALMLLAYAVDQYVVVGKGV